jgi:hypothetical protein
MKTVVLVLILAGSSGISRLTREAFREALACGRAGPQCAIAPYQLCPSMKEPFSAYIATPFSRVASVAYEQTRTSEKLVVMDAGEANAWGTGVYVMPGSHPLTADSIEKAVILQGDEVIQPLTTTIAPSGSSGANVPLSKAFFAFPMTAFAPTSSITVVLTGKTAEMRCTLDETTLKALR